MKIIQENNFCRVFEIPEDFPEGYLFAGPTAVNFNMVDWFNPIPADDIESDSVKPWNEYAEMLKDFLKSKNYTREGKKYLLITDFNESFVIEPT